MSYDCPAAWESGADPIYERLATSAIRSVPHSLSGRTVLDIGAGTGATSRAILNSHGWPLAVDLSHPMLAHGRERRPPAVVADATQLPIASAAVGGAVAGFCLSHVERPDVLLAEAARVVEHDGPVMAIVFADNASRHPVSGAVSEAATRLGWLPPPWYRRLKDELEPAVSDPDRLRSIAEVAGLAEIEVTEADVDLSDLGVAELIAWRLAGPALAPFVAKLDPRNKEWLTTEAARALGDEPSSLLLRIRTVSGTSS